MKTPNPPSTGEEIADELVFGLKEPYKGLAREIALKAIKTTARRCAEIADGYAEQYMGGEVPLVQVVTAQKIARRLRAEFNVSGQEGK